MTGWIRGAHYAKKEQDKLRHAGNRNSAPLKKAINEKGTHSCHLGAQDNPSPFLT